MTTPIAFPDRIATSDEWLWLEEIYGDEALGWVASQNETTLASLDQSTLKNTANGILEVLDSDDRIPLVKKHGDYLYNFRRDANHQRGVWRRTTLESYRTAEPDWDVLLDVDELADREEIQWVFDGARLLPHDYTRALISLSPDGGDAIVVREFDLQARDFVTDGFQMPHAKGHMGWIDRDTVFVTTDFGAGTVTTSSYPRQVRRWQRGTSLEDAEIILEIPEEHMGVWADHDATIGFERDILRHRIEFFTGHTYLVQNGRPVRMDVPVDVEVDFYREWLLLEPRSD